MAIRGYSLKRSDEAEKYIGEIHMDIIAGIQNALAIVGKLRELGKTVEDAEFKMMLADLSNELADEKLEAANLKMEIARLSTENQSLTDRLNTKETVRPVFADGGYRFPGDDGLYCTGCFDSRGEKIRLGQSPIAFQSHGHWRCPVCKTFAQM